MTGEARFLWTHGITPRKADIVPIKVAVHGDNAEGQCEEQRLTRCPRETRTSLTFRKLRTGPCNCGRFGRY